MTKRADLEGTIMEACREDHVGLWELVSIVERETPSGDPRGVTMGLLRKLLSEGVIRAGHPTPDGRGFVAWESALEETLSRIEFEWRRLKRRPALGEIVWFEEATAAPADQESPG